MIAALACIAALGCKPKSGSTVGTTAINPGTQSMIIDAPPEGLRGRVALPAGARLYSRPTYQSPSWELVLPDPPAIAADAPARVRAFRVVGIVRTDDALAPEFLAVTNDLDGDDPAAARTRGCGPRFPDLDHVRAMLYVPVVYLAEVTTRALELEPLSWTGDREHLQVGAGVRVGQKSPSSGLPKPPEQSSWRWIDADGIRVLAPIPDDAVGRAWDSALTPKLRKRGEDLMQDPEGSMLWLDDDGGDEVVFGVRNDCGEHQRVVTDAGEVQSLRALAMDVFYDQSPPRESEPFVPADADNLIVAGTPLRWLDGELAGEVLDDWAVSVGVGQSWGDRRCFPLVLSGELRAFDQVPVACVNPDALEPLTSASSFAATQELELGGTIEIGPPEILAGIWTESLLRPIFNSHHETVSECLASMLDGEAPTSPSRWVLEMIVDANGRVAEVEVTALGDTRSAVEDCLRVEAFTWLMPDGGGQVLVPITLGDWDNWDGSRPAAEPATDPAEDAPPAKPKAKSKSKSKPEPERERGKVVIIRDEDDEAAPEQ